MSFGGFGATPPRRGVLKSPTSPLPFCTSPTELQNALKGSANNGKSAIGTSSGVSRSVKEFEDEMTGLKKENFNLKLRIYFLEEKLGVNFTLDEDNAIKNNIELKVEIANLQKELQEKHDLLCQAVKAMELEDEEHRKNLRLKDEHLSHCQQEIEDLRLQLQLTCEKENSASLRLLLDQTDDIRQRLHSAEAKTAEKDATIDQLRQELDSQTVKHQESLRKIVELREQLEQSNKDNQALIRKMEEEALVRKDLLGQLSESKRHAQAALAEAEREQKKAERLRLRQDIRLDELETENEQLKARKHDLLAKLDAAHSDTKKHHSIAVPTALARDAPSTHLRVSDAHAAANYGAAQADAPAVPLRTPPSSPRSPSDRFDFAQLERVLGGADEQCARQVTAIVQQLAHESYGHKMRVRKLTAEQVKACEIIKTMIEAKNRSSEEVGALRRRCEQLELRLGANKRNTNENTMEETQTEDLAEHYKALSDELVATVELLKATVKAKDEQLVIIHAENEDLQAKLSGAELAEKVDCGSEKSTLADKDKEIERLNVELKKCTCYLQEIVNKELWEKNREIEKMHKRQNNSAEMLKLRKQLVDKDDQLKALIEKISQLGLDIPLPKGGGDSEQVSPMKCVQERNGNLLDELNKYKQLYQETTEASGILSNRLEELATFLDTLLSQKSVLGFLGIKKGRRLREIIDNSLELSRSFTMSMMVNPEQSLIQLSNITAVLNGSILQDLSLNNIEDEVAPHQLTLTYQSHIYKSSASLPEVNPEQVIGALREEVKNLKFELQLRDNELNKLNVNSADSSETEEKVSHAKIVFKSPTKPGIVRNVVSENQSESEAWSEPDIGVSKQRIGLNNTLPNLPYNYRKSDSTDDSLADQSSANKYLGRKLQETQRQIEHLKQELEVKSTLLRQSEQNVDATFDDLTIKLNTAEKQCDVYKTQVVELQRQLDVVSLAKKELEDGLICKDKDIQNQINALEKQRDNLLKNVQVLEQQADSSKDELLSYKHKLNVVNEEWTNKIKLVEVDHARQLEDLKLHYHGNYVLKTELDAAVEKLRQMSKDIEGLVHQEAISRQKERELEQLIESLKHKLSSLQAELDRKTREHSETALEKTRLYKDKVELETDFNRIKSQEANLKHQFRDMHSELDNMKQSFQYQVSSFESQRHKLELKVSELESTNAGLRNRLLKLQATGVPALNHSLPNRPIDFKRQVSEGQNYELAQCSPFNNSAPNLYPQALDMERQEANSSPDLGIESDHGRFSSLETHTTVPRPVLQTIELTESMNNLLSTETQQLENYKCDEACHQRVVDFMRENADLKKKLLRLKRAFEETAAQLAMANQRKKMLEKKICNEIQKTTQVLRKAKGNLDSCSESEAVKK